MQNVSEEQMVAVRHIIDGENVVLDAVAGSGKSTTILSMAKFLPGQRILQIAYNAMLRKEVEAKVKVADIQNVQVHTFHSLAVCYYLDSAHTDSGLRKIVLDNIPNKKPIPKFDIIVLDEAQDMSILYYQFMVKFAYDMKHSFQIFVLGDYMQGLYEFKGADIRALTYGHIIWENHPYLKSRVFHRCTLSMSYRITYSMAEFVNSAMIGENRLQACKTGEPVFYIRNSRRNLEIVVISQINLLLSNGASPGDIFVLGASVKGVNSNIRKMENALVERGIPCYVPTFDTERIDEKITEGKVVFSTFHSVKGRERKHVFVMGFDHSYFSIYASNLSTDICPNTLYVGCTRATQKLYLLEIDEYSTDRPLSFLKMTHHEMRDSVFVIFKGIPRSIFYEKVDDAVAKESSKTGEKYHDVTPTDLVKFVPEQVIDSISPILDTVFIQECEPSAEREIHIPNTIETARGFYEDVCDLNGIAIPSIYYDHIYRVVLNRPDSNIGANILKQIIYDCLNDTREGEYLYLKSMMKEMPETFSEVSDYLFLSNLFVAAKEKLLFKLKQIERTDYGWLSNSMVKECLDRLNQIIGDELSLEEPLVEYPIIQYDMEAEIERINQVLLPHFPEYDRKFRFSARTDLITEKCIWELKCTSSITIEHKLQVVLYDWLWRIVHSTEILSKKKRKNLKPRETRILNIKTGEIWFLNASFEELTTIVVALLKGKYDKPIAKTDEEFFIECKTYLSRFDKT